MATTIHVTGLLADPAYHEARLLATAIAAEYELVSAESQAFSETQWDHFVVAKSRELGRAAIGHTASPLVYTADGQYLGDLAGFNAWATKKFRVHTASNDAYYRRLANARVAAFMAGQTRPHAYLDIIVGSGRPRRVVIELFNDKCMRTCYNFLALCTGATAGLSYKNSPVHRVVPGGWVQMGDINGGHGNESTSVYGGPFEDESFEFKHDAEGIVSMASAGSPHTNGSQFFVTLAPLPWLDGQRVAFGRVVSGMQLFRDIAKQPLKNERPQTPCTIAACGVYDAACVAAAAVEHKDSGDVIARVFSGVAGIEDTASGDALADGLVTVDAAGMSKLLSDAGIDALSAVLRGNEALNFIQFASWVDQFARIYSRSSAVHADNPFGGDSRSAAQQAENMDLRRPSVKRKLLRQIFEQLDLNEDGKIEKSELVKSLERDNSAIHTYFPKHLHELPAWFAHCDADALNFDDFMAVAWKALSLPGGR